MILSSLVEVVYINRISLFCCCFFCAVFKGGITFSESIFKPDSILIDSKCDSIH